MLINKPVPVALISKTYTTDAIGQKIEVETSNTVSGYLESSSAAESINAGVDGLKRDKRVLVWAFEYNDENEVEIAGKRYAVYRTYANSSGKVELYLERRVGL